MELAIEQLDQYEEDKQMLSAFEHLNQFKFENAEVSISEDKASIRIGSETITLYAGQEEFQQLFLQKILELK